jgi:acyl-CoA synthetase (AMP-forming)/AMP-acid ligase II
VRYVTNAAAALPQALVPQVRAAFPHAQLFLMHGQTECLRTTFLPPEQLDARPASVGKGMPGVELWLEDEAGERLPPGSEGELVVRGDNVMLGYWNDPAATDVVVRAGRTPHERVLRTRDIFRTDAEGWFFFVSRTDDILKTRGEKVSPMEIEEVLFGLPEILEARVIGVPDDVLGQAIRAEIVLRPGCELTEREVRKHLRGALQSYKMPKVVAFVDSLPKSSGGKIRRTP